MRSWLIAANGKQDASQLVGSKHQKHDHCHRQHDREHGHQNAKPGLLVDVADRLRADDVCRMLGMQSQVPLMLVG